MPTTSGPDYSSFSHIDLMNELEALSQSIIEVEEEKRTLLNAVRSTSLRLSLIT